MDARGRHRFSTESGLRKSISCLLSAIAIKGRRLALSKVSNVRINLRWISVAFFLTSLPTLSNSEVIALTSHPTKVLIPRDDLANGVFTDLSTAYDGGVANPTDGSTGNVLQQTMLAAYFWGVSQASPAGVPARATVIIASNYPIHGTRLLVPGNVDLECSSYSPGTLTGGCAIFETDPGDNTATGGSTLLIADFTIGVLSDHKTWCSTNDRPFNSACIIISSSGGSIGGVTLYGGGASAGGRDIGVRIAADNFTVHDTAITGFFGGPGIQYVAGKGVNLFWNYGTNVSAWWCQNPLQGTPAVLLSALSITTGHLGGYEIPLVDGYSSYNQYSTGCAFAKKFAISREYEFMSAIHIGGANDHSTGDFAQTDGVGMVVDGDNQTVIAPRLEYTSREALKIYASNSEFDDLTITSACLDPNLKHLRPGAGGSLPGYPVIPTSISIGSIILDPNGNIEQAIYINQPNGVGITDENGVIWPTGVGETVNTTQIVWENVGPGESGLTANTDPGPVPALLNGHCIPFRNLGQNNTFGTMAVKESAGVNGPSYSQGSFYSAYQAAWSGALCYSDFPDAFGNGQCWWSDDLFANGGPPGLQTNGRDVSAIGGGTAWVGDYAAVFLEDLTPQHYSNFQGMADGQQFLVTSRYVTNIIDSWSVNNGGSLYSHPSLLTCGGVSQSVGPNQYLTFRYDRSALQMITQLDCPVQNGGPLLSLSPTGLSFPSQSLGIMSSPQNVTLSNLGTSPILASITAAGDFEQTNTCGISIAPGVSCVITVTFTPTATGTHVGQVVVTDNAANSPQVVALAGEGQVPPIPPAASAVLSASTGNLYFSPLLDGAISAAQTDTLTNTGSAHLLMTLEATGEFSETNNCPRDLGVNASCTVYVTFSPSVAGTASGAIVFTSNSSPAAAPITLIGTGVAPAIVPPASNGLSLTSTLSMVTVAEPGQTARVPVVLASLDGFAGNVILTCDITYAKNTPPPDPPTCAAMPMQIDLASNQSSPGSFTINTTNSVAAISCRTSPPLVLAGCFVFWLLPLSKRKRQLLYAFLTCVFSMTVLSGCGLSTNDRSEVDGTTTTAGDYVIVIHATGDGVAAQLSIPLKIN